MKQQTPVVVTTKAADGSTRTSVPLTGSMRRLLFILTRRANGEPPDHPLKPNEQKLIAMADAGLIDFSITDRGRMAIEADAESALSDRGTCNGCDEDEEDRQERPSHQGDG